MAMALMLSLVRRVPAADRSMKAGEWDKKSFSGAELYGKTLLLVGAGRIGGEVAIRARAFGMKVLVYDPFLSQEKANVLQVELATSLDDVLPLADILSVHTPFTAETANLLSAARLAMLKPGAYLVNAARGGIVDEAALANALNTGALGGAALDVYSSEPLPAEHPLRSARNIVLTPHLGASTQEAQRNVASEIAIAVREALLEGDLSRAVNAPSIGGEAMRRIQPLLDLAQRLGAITAALSDGSPEQVEVRYAGAESGVLQPVSASVLIGLLSHHVEPYTVNIVNALHSARARGIQVSQVTQEPYRGYAEYIEVVLKSGARSTRVAGALLSRGHPRLVRVQEFHVDVNPRGTIIVIRNRDVPGVIGHVGTLLGEAKINIGEYHQARLAQSGEALAAITVDGPVDPAVVNAFRALPDVNDVRVVTLG
jgi:D-3-phosphoglycerate dehydrogenase